jgi:hypothetical protein
MAVARRRPVRRTPRMYSSARSVAVSGGATSEAVEQVEHAAASDPDRIVGRKHLEIADRARPLEAPKTM